jgi:lysozyme
MVFDHSQRTTEEQARENRKMKYNREALIDQLILHEGMELQVYKDHLGIDTIGVGRNLEDRGITDGELAFMNMLKTEVYEQGITEAHARFLLANDIDIVEKELSNAHPCISGIGDVRIRVLLDMGFNLGVPRLNKFKNMWKAVHDRDFSLAAVEMLDSRWASQVGQRAVRLANAMRDGELIV